MYNVLVAYLDFMVEIDTEWSFAGAVVRRWIKQGMVNVTDIWKAAGCPAPMRPDKWFKADLIQEKLESLAIVVAGGVERDKNGKLIKVPGVLEVIRGGRYMQGTFSSYDLAIIYTQLLDTKVYEWFTSVLPSSREEVKVDGGSKKLIPVDLEDFNGKVRFTPEGEISVLDAIQFVVECSYPTAHKNWERLQQEHSEVSTKCRDVQFPDKRGRLNKPTPVAVLQVFLEIVTLLPGKLAAAVREEAIRTLIRAMNGDPTLVEEIVSRIKNPQDLKDLEESIRVRRVRTYGSGDSYSGTLSNPLTVITPEIRKGYGWHNKSDEMISLLAELATHAGDMVIERESPHRSYDYTSKSKSRRIPLTIRTLKNLETLHIYIFESNYVDDSDVIEVFGKCAYPELAYRDFLQKGVKFVVAHLVSPAGITVAGFERLQEIQKTLDEKYQGAIILDSMILSELVWGEMYPAIKERYSDASGKFGWHHLNLKIKKICSRLCEQKTFNKVMVSSSQPEYEQLSFLSELLQLNK